MAARALSLALVVQAASGAPLGPTVTLRGGIDMPSIGSGSGGGCGPDSFGGPFPCAQYNNTLLYLRAGGRALHDALSYGNQFGTGAAVKAAATQLGIKREEIFMMSMVPREMMGYNLTKRAVAASLAQLQVDYIDLVMFHHRAADISAEPLKMKPMQAFPDHPDGTWGPPPCSIEDPTWQTCQDEGWRALVELKKQGKIKAIGVSNWMLSNLKRMKSLGQELPAVNQVEAHIGWCEDDLNEWCQANGVVLQAATPMARGLPALVTMGADKTVSGIATKYKKSPAQVSLRFLLDKGIAAIPSAHTAAYMKENLDVHTALGKPWRLAAEELTALSKISTPCRGAPCASLCLPSAPGSACSAPASVGAPGAASAVVYQLGFL